MNLRRNQHQEGVSVAGLIIILAFLGVLAMLAAKIIPALIEYRSIRDAMYSAKANGTTAREIQDAFDKQKISGYFTAIGGRDLEVVQENGKFEVSFAYEKKIPLIGPASIVFDFEATTATTNPLGGPKKKAVVD